MRAIEFRVESVSISRLSDSDRDAWVLREFSKEWIFSLVVKETVVDESRIARVCGVEALGRSPGSE